jgi:hypothetical protein
VSGARPFGTTLATDEVIDTIAEIEMQRQATEKEGGFGAASSGALRRLHELLDREQAALQLHGPNAGHPANIAAVTVALEGVTKMTGGIKTPRPMPGQPGSARPERQSVSWRNAPRNPNKSRGRRTMGRAGGR